VQLLNRDPVVGEESDPGHPTSPTLTGPGPSHLVLALLSAGAAAIHFAFAPDHLDEDGIQGAFFLVVGWLQLLWAFVVIARPSPRLLLLGLLNGVVAAVWVVSRTSGLPGEAAETVALPDALATAFEVLICVGVVVAVSSRRPSRSAIRLRSTLVLPLVLGVLVVGGTGTALTPRFAAGHEHDPGEDTSEASGGHAHASGAVAEPAADHHGNVGVQNADQEAELQPDQPLDPATRSQLADQLTVARAAAMRYPTLADATAAGMFPAGEFTPGAGAHYLSPGGAAASFLPGGTFDAANPATWIYDGMSPTSRVVGLMWISSEEEAPEGFAGPNDHWHRHFNTCIRSGTNGIAGIEVPFAADQDVTREMCEGVNGTFMESTVWMVHAWVVPSWESPNGVFSHDNPNLVCADGTTRTDPAGFCQGT
jgi:hypothetical protein